MDWLWPIALRSDLLRATPEQRRQIGKQLSEMGMALEHYRFFVWDDQAKCLVEAGTKDNGPGGVAGAAE